MSTDLFGAPTTAPNEAKPLIDRFTDGLVTYRADAADVLRVTDEFDRVAMVQISAAVLTLLAERVDAAAAAQPFLDRATTDPSANQRERTLQELTQAWANGKVTRAADIGEQLLAEYPTDLLTLRLVQYFRFGQGDYPAMLRAALHCERSASDQASYWTMAAFAYEQCHRMDEAANAAETALAIKPDHPWGHHALAHVYLTRGEVDRGRAFLSDRAPTWQGLNSFMYTHLWWHQALFELATDGVRGVLHLYDQRCWGIDRSYSQDQIGAVSLLAQLECAGVDVGDRWNDLAPWLETRADDTLSPFRTLQYLYGLARANSAAATDLLAAIRRRAAVPSDDAARWKQVAIPAAEGLYALAIGDPDIAVARLSPVIGRMWKLGGSHAQRDLFTQLWLDALMRAERWVDAQQVVDRRRRWIADHPVVEAQADRIDAELGLAPR